MGDRSLKPLLLAALVTNILLLLSIGYRYSFATTAAFSFEPAQLLGVNRKILNSPQASDERIQTDIPWLFIVTPTRVRLEQKADLTRLSQTLQHVKNLWWTVIEDAPSPGAKVEGVLKRSGLRYCHLATNARVGSVMMLFSGRGMAQRNLGLEWIQRCFENGTITQNGIMYFADDDNTYDVRLFDDYIRRVTTVGIWAVGLVGGTKVESPRVVNGRVVGWDVSWAPHRSFATDMAGFAVHLSILLKRKPRFHKGCGTGHFEPCFVQQLGVPKEKLEPFGFDGGKKEVLVWHTKTGNGGSGGSDKGFEV